MYRVAVCDDNREILNEIGRMLEDTTEEISTYMHPPRNLRTYIQNMGNTTLS